MQQNSVTFIDKKKCNDTFDVRQQYQGTLYAKNVWALLMLANNTPVIALLMFPNNTAELFIAKNEMKLLVFASNTAALLLLK